MHPLVVDERKHFQRGLEGSDKVQRDWLFERHNGLLLPSKLVPLAFLPLLFFMSSYYLTSFLPLQSMTTMNQTYMIIYDIFDNVAVLKAEL